MTRNLGRRAQKPPSSEDADGESDKTTLGRDIALALGTDGGTPEPELVELVFVES